MTTSVSNSFKQNAMRPLVDESVKMALYTSDVVLDSNTTTYSASNEISAWSEYSAGGVALTITGPTIDTNGSVYVDVADVSFSDIPVGTQFRYALLYFADRPMLDAIAVIDFGRTIQIDDGMATFELARSDFGIPLIRIA